MEWITTPVYCQTDWKTCFVLLPVFVETLYNSDIRLERVPVKAVWLKKIERRQIILAGRKVTWIYREIGSTWDYTPVTPIPPSGGTAIIPLIVKVQIPEVAVDESTEIGDKVWKRPAVTKPIETNAAERLKQFQQERGIK